MTTTSLLTEPVEPTIRELSRSELGALGEDLVSAHLAVTGRQIIERNYRCRYGEIDIVHLDADTLAFCEVKTRRTRVAGDPFEAITPEKRTRLRRLAGFYLSDRDRYTPHRDIRIDAAAVLLLPGRAPQIRLLLGV